MTPGRLRIGPVWLLVCTVLLSVEPVGAASDLPPLPPSPYAILGSRLLEPPLIDALPVCLPEGLPTELREIVGTAAGGELEGALEVLEGVDPDTESRSEGWQRLAAILRARVARGADVLRIARRELQASLASGNDAGLDRVCAGLELARVELLLGLLPEAGVSITRAIRSSPARALAGPLRARAEFYQAEALTLRGEHREAEGLYTRLAESGVSALEPAVRLREVDRLYQQGKFGEALKGYESLLDEAKVVGAPTGVWAPRVAEAALHASALDAANYWLGAAQSEAEPVTAALLEIRRGDLRFLQGNLSESHDSLETVAKEQEGKPVGDLARLRLHSLDLGAGSVEGELETLRELTRSDHRGVATRARALLLHRLLQREAIDEGLELMAFLAYDRPDPALAPGLSGDLDGLLLAAAGGAGGSPDCPRLLRLVGSRRNLFLAEAHASEPFLRLGDCYLGHGMPQLALEIYRSVTGRFGPQRAEVIALRMARAALESGDVATARAAARARAGQTNLEADPWALLLAEADLADGWSEKVVDRLVPLVREGRPGKRFPRAVYTLARAAVELEPDEHVRSALHRSFVRLETPAPGGDAEDVGAAALYTGELYRRAGKKERARRYYAQAVKLLSEGAVQSEAAYWLGTLERRPEAAQAAWEIAAHSPEGGPWSRLARNEIRLSQVRAEIGRSTPAASAGRESGSGS